MSARPTSIPTRADDAQGLGRRRAVAADRGLRRCPWSTRCVTHRGGVRRVGGGALGPSTRDGASAAALVAAQGGDRPSACRPASSDGSPRSCVGSTRGRRSQVACGLSEIFVGSHHRPDHRRTRREHSSAILMAMKNRMDLAVTIARGLRAPRSRLLIAPVLGLRRARHRSADGPWPSARSRWIGRSPLGRGDRRPPWSRDAESNWLEGAFLLLVYGMLGVAFLCF